MGLFDNSSPSPDHNSWQAFPEDSTASTLIANSSKSVRTRNGHQNKQPAEPASGSNANWGFEAESFTAVPSGSSKANVPIANKNPSQRFGDLKNKEGKSASQPAGWAGF